MSGGGGQGQGQGQSQAGTPTPPPQSATPPPPPQYQAPPPPLPPQQQNPQQATTVIYQNEPSQSALQVRAEKERELAQVEDYWKNRVKDIRSHVRSRICITVQLQLT